MGNAIIFIWGPNFKMLPPPHRRLGGTRWNHIRPTQSLAGCAIIGGAAFLASSMKMPLTAIVLTVEFTGIDQKFLIPLSLAVAGSVSIFHLCNDYADQPMRAPGADTGS